MWLVVVNDPSHIAPQTNKKLRSISLVDGEAQSVLCHILADAWENVDSLVSQVQKHTLKGSLWYDSVCKLLH